VPARRGPPAWRHRVPRTRSPQSQSGE
jgi:hypothetical protein